MIRSGIRCLVAGQSGDGRVLAFAGDSTWRWPMLGFGDAHRRFWRQCVLWLAKKDEQTEGRVWIRLAGRRAMRGTRVDFAVGAENAQGEPIDTAQFRCRGANAGWQRSERAPDENRRRNGRPTFRETDQAGRLSNHGHGERRRRTSWERPRRGSWCRIRIWSSIGRRPSRRSWPNWPR